MQSDLTCLAPAKLNLFLHIIGRRSDGYHNLQTVFQFLDFADTLHFKLRQDGQITLHDNTGLAVAHNIVWRAANLLKSHAAATIGVDIYLEKRIPIGGGLGGGSSNAATTLLALNYLWELQLPYATLLQYALQLGADVPIFVFGQAAFAEGIGEQLQAINPPTPWYVVLIPDCQVNTTEFFSHPELTRDTSPIRIGSFQLDKGHNDFTPLVRKMFPQITMAMDWLQQYTEARLTGSGCCVFGAFAKQQQAEEVLAKLPKELRGFVAQGLNVSPIHYLLS